VTEPRPVIATGRRTVIDPKCDTRANARRMTAFKNSLQNNLVDEPVRCVFKSTRGSIVGRRQLQQLFLS
jgi:hypothetical protein